MKTQSIAANFRFLLNEQGVSTQGFDDEFLCIFLRVRKFNMNASIKTFSGFSNSLRNIFPNKWLTSPRNHSEIYASGMGGPLKRLDKLGRKLICVRFEKWNPLKFTYDAILAATALNFLEIMTCTSTQEHGIVLIVDLKGFSFQHAQLFGYKRCKLIVELFQGSFPVKVKEIHFVNTPRVFTIVYAFFKLFIKAKLMQRLKIHGFNLETLHRDVEARLLPKDLGGCLPYEDVVDNIVQQNLLKRNAYYTSNFLSIYDEIRFVKDAFDEPLLTSRFIP